MEEIINVVALDDDPRELLELVQALAIKGISTLPIHFNEAVEALEACTNVSAAMPRIIITDIQMQSGGPEPTNADYAIVGTCIKNIIERTTGPYIVLAWTSKNEAFEALKEYVERYLAKENVRKPVYFSSICKKECKPEGIFSSAMVFDKFAKHLETEKQFRALLDWEKSVIKAAVSTVNDLIEVAKDELPVVLNALASQVVGKHLKGNEASAINEAFSYVLKDKTGLYSLNDSAKIVWAEALGESVEISQLLKHQLNNLLHVDTAQYGQTICPGDVWISDDASSLLSKLTIDGDIARQLQQLKDQILIFSDAGNEMRAQLIAAEGSAREAIKLTFKSKFETPLKNAQSNSQVCLMEISPACDFSGKKKPLKTFIVGSLVLSEELTSDIVIKKADFIINMPLMFEGKEHHLVFCSKYIVSLSDAQIKEASFKLRKIFRIRENLLQSWIHKIAYWNSRIGTVSFQ